MRKIFLLTMLFCCFLLGVAQAATVNDVKWGVDKNNVLRFVVDIDTTAGYDARIKGSNLELTVNAKKAAQVPSQKAIRSDLADKMNIIAQGESTVLRVPMKKYITDKDYKAFVLKQDPATGRPFRVVLDVTAAKRTAAAVGSSTAAGAAAGNKPVVSSRPTVGKNGPTVPKQTAEKKAAAQKAAAEKAKAEQEKKLKAEAEKKKQEALKKAKEQKKNKKSTAQTDAAAQTATATEAKTTANGELAAVKATRKYRVNGGIKDKVITIDPGHGGSDPGAIGAKGTYEKNITLIISKLVQEELEKKGAIVHMTRTTDVDVHSPNASDRDELQARVNVAEKHNSDAFVSLHINASVNKSVGGFSTYYCPKTSFDGQLANSIQKKLGKGFSVNDLGTRQANFYVNKRSSMPSVLVEMCFITNQREEDLLNNTWFQKKTARLISEGIEEYFI